MSESDADSIAQAMGRLVTAGEISPGDKLPPIRQVAARLGVSTATVAVAWSTMRGHGLIETNRRLGTTVRPFRGHGRSRYWRVPIAAGTLALDLSTGTPDPVLLPPLGPVLAKLETDLVVTSYLEPPVLAELETELRRQWPYDPPAMAVVDGANDGLDRVVAATIRLGDVVVVEEPTYPLLLDILELAGAEVIGVPLDDEGPDPDAFEAALAHNPVAVVVQTGAHNPTGISLSQHRADALSEIVRRIEPGRRPLLIEDNHAGASSDREPVSLGVQFPELVYRIHSFSKTYGPDLRIAALSGPSDGVAEIQQRRQLGPGWTSRLLQRVLLEMLRSDEVAELTTLAAHAYRDRRTAMCHELASHGISLPEGSGLNIWVPVAREQMATVSLAAQGIGVAPGEPFRVTDPNQFIRVTVAHVRDDAAAVAERIAKAGQEPD